MDLSPQCSWPLGSPAMYLPINGPVMSKGHPMTWTKEDVYKWIEWCIEEYSLGDISLEKFSMNGKALLLLSKEDFKERAPNAGDILYTTLQNLLESPLYKGVVPQSYPSPFSFYPRPMALTYGPPVRHHTDSSLSQVYLRSDSSSILSPTAIRFCPIRPQTSPIVSTEADRHPLSTSPSCKTEDTFPSPPQSASESDASSADMPRALNSPVSPKTESPEQTTKLGEALDECEADRQVSHFNQGPDYSTSDQDAIQNEKYDNTPMDCSQHKTLKLKNNKDCRLLWEFIGRLLTDPKRSYESCIKWEDEGKLIFRITNPAFLAYLWGMQKNRNNMTYEKLSRALRYYYRMNIIEKVPGRRLTYRFMHPPDEIKVERSACRYRPERTMSSSNEESMAHLDKTEVSKLINMSLESAGFRRGAGSPHPETFEGSTKTGANELTPRVSPTSITFEGPTKTTVNDLPRVSPTCMRSLLAARPDTCQANEPMNSSIEMRTSTIINDGTTPNSPKTTEFKNPINKDSMDYYSNEEGPQDLSLKTELRAEDIKQEVAY